MAVRQGRETDVHDELHEGVEADIDEDVLEESLQEARQLEPVIPDTEKKTLRDYYVRVKTELSRRDPDGERFPVTPRSLLDLLTLASASAKARMSETIEMVDVERTTRLMTHSFVELGLAPDESAVVEADDSSAVAVDSGGAPEVVLKEVVNQLKFEGSDYGTDRERVLERAEPDVDSRSKAELDTIVETMLEAETLHSTSDGRLS